MTTKLISLAGLVLLLSSATCSSAFASTDLSNAAPTGTAQSTQVNQNQNVVRIDVSPLPSKPQVQQLAWQRVGAPLSLEG